MNNSEVVIQGQTRASATHGNSTRGATDTYEADDVFVGNDDEYISYSEAKGDHVDQIRFGGNLHLDRRPSGWIWHYDAYGSWIKNPFTMLHHVAFEAGGLSPSIHHAMYNIYQLNFTNGLKY